MNEIYLILIIINIVSIIYTKYEWNNTKKRAKKEAEKILGYELP